MPSAPDNPVRLALPKGRIQAGVVALLRDAGVEVRGIDRDYRPSVSLPGFDAKLLKPRDIVNLLAAGARDVAFAGADWVADSGADLVELLDTGMDPVRLVTAAPPGIFSVNGRIDATRRVVIATEYVNLTRRWIQAQGLDATVLPTTGATEVFPPEDADCIVDNTATGSTLRANGLVIVDELMRSSTRLYASVPAIGDPAKAERIETLRLLVASVLEARRRAMLDMNVPGADLERVIEVLPCMREPSISRLHDQGWFAVRAAVPRADLSVLIPELRRRGARDIVTTIPDQIVP